MTTPAPVVTTPVTQVFTGSTTQRCSGDSHNFTAAAGDISVRLLETTDPAGALSVQICGGGIDNGNCSIKQQKIAVGQVIAGSRVGVPEQTLKLLAHGCVFGPAGPDSVTYRVEVTYQH